MANHGLYGILTAECPENVTTPYLLIISLDDLGGQLICSEKKCLRAGVLNLGASAQRPSDYLL